MAQRAVSPRRKAGDVLDLVGQKWLLHVVCEVCEGLTRFNQIQASLGISRALLTVRLRLLVAEGIVETTALPGSACRLQYVPTESGLSLYRILLEMTEWELKTLNRHGHRHISDHQTSQEPPNTA